MSSTADTKPRVPSIFEPGSAFNDFGGSEETEASVGEEKESPFIEENKQASVQVEEMFDVAAKRNFVARRGRNNRILLKPILQNVFKDTSAEENETKSTQVKG